MKYILSTILLVSALGFTNQLFKSEFLSLKLQSDKNGDGKISVDEVDPPAGHGLPQFSAPIDQISADQLENEMSLWKMSEALAEEEFYAQTDAAVADGLLEIESCNEIEDEEEREICKEETQADIDSIYDMISDLQIAHAGEEEAYGDAMADFLKEKRERERLGLAAEKTDLATALTS